MLFVKYLPLTILLFFLLKLVTNFIHSKSENLKKELLDKDITNGFISIKDLQPNNYNRFIEAIKSYLSFNNFLNIEIQPGGTSDFTNIIATLNEEKVFINCVQKELTASDPKEDDTSTCCNLSDVERFIANLIINNCSKGIIITNSIFNKHAKDSINKFNTLHSNIEANTLTGYELTKSVRAYDNYLSKEVLQYDNE